MYSRIKELRKSLGLTQLEFGEKIGVRSNTITNYETGLRNPSDAVIRSICREFHVNEDWLRTGNGAMFSEQKKADEIARFLADVMMDDDESFRFRFASALAKMDDSGWDALEKFLDDVIKRKE